MKQSHAETLKKLQKEVEITSKDLNSIRERLRAAVANKRNIEHQYEKANQTLKQQLEIQRRTVLREQQEIQRLNLRIDCLTIQLNDARMTTTNATREKDATVLSYKNKLKAHSEVNTAYG